MGEYLSTNIVSEATTSLVLVEENMDRVTIDTGRWKWVIIALHNGLQNVMVCALRQGNGFHSMSNGSYKEWMEAYRANEKLPKTRLAGFLDLYKRIKKKSVMERYTHSRAFEAEQRHTESIKKLNQIRNRFIHFETDIWSLQVSGLPYICSNCMEIIHFLVFKSGHIISPKTEQVEDLRDVVHRVSEKFESVKI